MLTIDERLLKASRGSCIYEDADACTDAIAELAALRERVAELEKAIGTMQQHLGGLSSASFKSQFAERKAWEAWCIAETILHPPGTHPSAGAVHE